MRYEERVIVRILIAIMGLIIGWIAYNAAYTNFIDTGVTPNVAAEYSVIIFALVLAAFGLIAVKIDL
jgi:polyferredoxin